MKKALVLLSFVSISGSVFSQNLEPFQYAQNPLLLNPAFAGSSKVLKVSADYRMNYWGTKKNTINFLPSTTYSVDHYFNKIKSGVGINFNSTYPGFGDDIVHLMHSGLDYSYHIPLGKDSAGNAKYFLQPGIEYGFQFNTLDTTGFYNPNFPQNYVSYSPKVTYSDLSAGFIFYGKDICVGFSARHLNQPNEGYGYVYKLPTFYSGSLAYSIRFGRKGNFYFQPNASYMYYYGSSQVAIVGAKLNLGSFNFGISYSTKQAFAYSFGMHEGRFYLGYMYDHSSYKSDWNWVEGGHEITFRVKLFVKQNKILVNTQDIL